MAITRRNLLKATACGGALMACGTSVQARQTAPRLNEALGILYDSTICIGCQACMSACKKANDMPPDPVVENSPWDNPRDLSSKTLTVIQRHYDPEIPKGGSAFIKKQCMHCVDPGCVSACPVSAMTKDPKTGVVTYNKDACIGCRYCQIACPYNVPKFEWDKPLPQIIKCQLCSHLIEKGGISACCSGCPTGASLFGPVELLKKEAQRRLQYNPGEIYEFPLEDIRSGRTVPHTAAKYTPHVFGETELGGSQVMYLSAVDFDKFGLPDLPDESYASMTESIQHTLYKGMFLPIVLLVGLVYSVKRNTEDDDSES